MKALGTIAALAALAVAGWYGYRWAKPRVARVKALATMKRGADTLRQGSDDKETSDLSGGKYSRAG